MRSAKENSLLTEKITGNFKNFGRLVLESHQDIETTHNDLRTPEIVLGESVISFKGQPIKRDTGNVEMNWRITNLKDPHIEYKGEPLLQIISEALECWGYFFFTKDIEGVNVTLAPALKMK